PDAGAPDAGDAAAAGSAEAVGALRGRVTELEDLRRRALADVDNLRKRFDRELDRARTHERERVATAWLPVVDHLDLALSHAGSDPGALTEGVRAVRDQAVDVLARLGFTRHADEGVPFDPGLHEAVSVSPGAEAPDGTVLHVVRPGYGEGEQQLRPASVVVAKKAD
ncbi:MAG: molecular chaperone GrpE, partial [Streptosporangiaceae bacterium]|nr:molecular chaperone GrpE [Streptosporangiaceae bacterium]